MGIFSNRRRRKTDSFASRVPSFRWLGPGITFGGLLTLAFYIFAGDFRFKAFDDFVSSATTGTEATGPPVVLSMNEARPADRIRIATFNIEKFGPKKSSTRMVPSAGVDVMGSIAQIVTQFDLVAIQEVLGKDGQSIQVLLDLINQSGGQYTGSLSEPIGESSYKESYAFVWDQTRIRMIQNSAYVVSDDSRRMYREPMVASFETRVDPQDGRRPFRFTIINAHTRPDSVSPSSPANEINVLDDVFLRVRDHEFRLAAEEDFLLVGDLNVDANNLQEIATIPNLVSVAGSWFTNTAQNKTYDHILMDQTTTREFTGNAGVLNYSQLGLSREQADLVSDHMPVWAEFSAFETPYIAPVANRSTRFVR